MIFFYTVAGLVLLFGMILAVLYGQFYWCKSSRLSSLSEEFSGEKLKCIQADAYYHRGHFFHERSMFERALTNYDAALNLDSLHPLVSLYKKYAMLQQIMPAIIGKEAGVADESASGANGHFANVLKRTDVLSEEEGKGRSEIPEVDVCERSVPVDNTDTASLFDGDVSPGVTPDIILDLEGDETDGGSSGSASDIELFLEDENPPSAPLKVDAIDDGQECIVRGKMLLQKNLFAGAIQEYTKAIAVNPQDCEAYLGRAAALTKTAKIIEAIADFDKAIELKPNHIAARNKRGDLFLHLNKVNEAIDAYTVSLAIDPEQAKCLKRRGVAYFRAEKFNDALNDFSRSISLDPECRATYQDRAMALKQLGMLEKAPLSPEVQEVFEQGMQQLKNGNDAQALLSFNQVLKKASEHSDSYFQRGNINLKNKGYDRAITDYSKAIELNPSLGMAYLNRGQANIFANLYFDAIADFDKAVEIMPECADVYLHRGRANSQRAQRDEAIADFSRAIEIDAENSTAHFDRGAEWQNLGEYDKALPDFEKACSLGNNAACIAYMNLKEEQ